ncbi:MAG: [LysW]-aminoadipate kinase, partial [Thermomicrobiaceae bacterium]|nr:[LysW]-aminoadipate kinase [Thermomicrobiaceae bacterium]
PLGGWAGSDPGPTLDDLAALWPGEPVVLVHGANATLDEWTRRLGREPRLVRSASGQVSRYTDRETMDLFLAVYAGLANKRLVEGLQARGVDAVGLSALDGGIARGRRKESLRIVEDGKPKVLRGDYAGSIEEVDTRLLRLLLGSGYLPVLTPPAVSQAGEAINVDGDKLALRLAIALGADALVILSNTPGLLADLADPASRVPAIDVSDAASVEAALAMANGRMKKKVLAGRDAVLAGIGKVVFADARVERPVRRALAGEGTVLLAGEAIGARP